MYHLDLGCHSCRLESDEAGLYSGWRLTTMGEGQPIGEVPGGFVGGMTVERHHSGRNTWAAQQLCTPTIADRHDLDEVRASSNGLFEAMYGHSAIVGTKASDG